MKRRAEGLGEFMSEDHDFAFDLHQLVSKEASVFEKFIALYTKMTYAYVYGVLENKEDAEDLVQEVFLKLYTLDERQFPRSGERSWYYKFCTNLAKDYRRRIKFTEDLEEHIPFLAAEDDQIQEIEAMSAYYSAVSSLSDLDRTIVGLKVLAGLKHREIADIVGRPAGTVRWRYMRAVHTLRAILGTMAVGVISLIILFARPPRATAPAEPLPVGSFFQILLLSLILLSIGISLWLVLWSRRRKCLKKGQ